MAKKKSEDGGRHFESKFDEKALREMIQNGVNADDIQKNLGIVSKQSLRQHVMRLCHIDRVYYDVKGLYVRNLKRPQVSIKGDVRLTRAMLDFPGSTYSHGDQFELRVDNQRIVLTRLSDSAEPVEEEPEESSLDPQGGEAE